MSDEHRAGHSLRSIFGKPTQLAGTNLQCSWRGTFRWTLKQPMLLTVGSFRYGGLSNRALKMKRSRVQLQLNRGRSGLKDSSAHHLYWPNSENLNQIGMVSKRNPLCLPRVHFIEMPSFSMVLFNIVAYILGFGRTREPKQPVTSSHTMPWCTAVRTAIKNTFDVGRFRGRGW